MAILIDGYNLLHVTGIFGRGVRSGTLERSRRALLNFLASALDDAAVARTTVVFDAKDAPPGLPRLVRHNNITVHFAAGYAEADDLLEELIQQESAPKQLTVVSSDHRVQRAARRRGCKPVDSDIWFTDVVRNRDAQPQVTITTTTKPAGPLTDDEVSWWLSEFSDEIDELRAERTRAMDQPTTETTHAEEVEPPALKPDVADTDNMANPFPPGYAEDLLDE